jgi:hypothetical protein
LVSDPGFRSAGRETTKILIKNLKLIRKERTLLREVDKLTVSAVEMAVEDIVSFYR